MAASPEYRPDPDILLARVQDEERQKHRGKLKIFLGYIAGVGKTYEMLQAAHLRKHEGVDVQIGYVETHGRAETEALVEGLPVIPRKMIEYRNVTLPEMDLDAILAARPHLVLVDELAHTNAPGSRHVKRYQDVEELLDSGIDVYTTLNVQHIESLNDVVAQITGVIVAEKVPDRVIDEAPRSNWSTLRRRNSSSGSGKGKYTFPTWQPGPSSSSSMKATVCPAGTRPPPGCGTGR